jgi:hypothetical protein
MGQPTSGITQRAGRSQCWQHVPTISALERGFGEHQFRLTLAAKLTLLFFQSLALPAPAQFWLKGQVKRQLYKRNSWGRYWRTFPNLYKNRRRIFRRYFEQGAPRFLLYDGEYTYMSLAYKHRRLRFTTLFWAQPRFFKMSKYLILSLRGNKMTRGSWLFFWHGDIRGGRKSRSL